MLSSPSQRRFNDAQRVRQPRTQARLLASTFSIDQQANRSSSAYGLVAEKGQDLGSCLRPQWQYLKSPS